MGLEPNELNNKYLSKGMAIAMPIGGLFGFVLMIIADNVVFLTTGIAMGLAVGVAIGTGMAQRHREEE